jgi:hypothetical protein
VYPYYNKTAISHSILSKKSSAIIIIVAINHIVIALSKFGSVLYYFFYSKARASEIKVLERELKNKREKEKSHSC